MNKLKPILTKDLGWKFISVLIAVFMWFIVLNIENPIESRTFYSNLTIQNENAILDGDKTITNIDEIEDMQIRIRLRGKRLTLDNLQQSKEVSAYIDLSTIGENYNGNEAVVSVKVKMPSISGEAVSVEYISPSTVTLKVDDLVSKEIPVTLEETGEVAANKAVGSLTANPATITVFGPSADVDKASSIHGVVDVTDLEDDKNVEVTPAVYDAEGNVMQSLILSDPTINVSVDMKDVKTVPIEGYVSGVTTEGYVVESVSTQPSTIDVMGEASDLENFDMVLINSVNVFGRSQTFTTDVYISNYLPQGIDVKKGASEKVQLTVNIGKQSEKEFTFNTKDVVFEGYDSSLYDVQVQEEDLTMTVSGNRENIGAFDPASLKYSVNLSGLEEGTHTVGVFCELPYGIDFYGDIPMVTVNIVSVNENMEETN